MAEGFDFANLAAIAEFRHSHGQTLAPCTAGPANAVSVVFGLHGQAEVEHVGDGRHVDATGGHVGRHQNLHLAIAQGHEAAVAQALAQSAMQCHGGKAYLLQVGRQGITFDLRAGKHDGLVNGSITQPVIQQLALVFRAVTPVQALLDVDVLVLRGVDLHLLRTAHHSRGQGLNTGRKSGTEHHGLATRGGQSVDFRKVIGETEIQHAVGFINHQKLHLVQLDLAAALQIQQAARGGHHQVGVLQLGDLHLVRHATDHVGNTQASAVLDQVDRIMRHLLGQFTRGAQHQSPRHGGLEVTRQQRVLALRALGSRLPGRLCFGHQTVPFGPFLGFTGALLFQQGVQYRQQEGGGFATTGLAGDHQVSKDLAFGAVVHGFGNGGLLNERGLGEPQIGHGLDQRLGQAQSDKGFRQGCRLRIGGLNRIRHVMSLREKSAIEHDEHWHGSPRVPDRFVVEKTSTTNKSARAPETGNSRVGCKAYRLEASPDWPAAYPAKREADATKSLNSGINSNYDTHSGFSLELSVCSSRSRAQHGNHHLIQKR